MKKIILVLILAGFQTAFSQQTDIKRTIDTFFEGMHTSDTVKIKAVTVKEFIMHDINEKPSGSSLSVRNRDALLRAIMAVPESVTYEEKLLSWNFQIDGNLAQVWTPYEFYINGGLVHTGVNSFQLFYDKGNWKIMYCADTRKRS